MIQAETDRRLVMYGDAVHGFTHRHAVPGQIPCVDHDRAADEESFEAAAAFLTAAAPRTD